MLLNLLGDVVLVPATVPMLNVAGRPSPPVVLQLNTALPPMVFLTTTIVPLIVLVNVHVTVSPGCTLKLAGVEAELPVPPVPEHTADVRSHPVSAPSVIV